ncbi:hypothetical protein GCM10010918_49100 [Paenibacillus radicis (ex Gao et al. 2016)]|uniref:Uncharacterized protein n=2 Tax=Paenibacillus radicis (ex Gao et al. 2016) TaxID=1737354 RepID=A0A917HPC7_9BACL|nr:hypothetical protein GCM10010918_49100 [Paenibacillus radicis (ex Gao et al. 2016)]
MDAEKKRSFRRATLIAVLASVIYALIGNTFFNMAYYSDAIFNNSYWIAAVLAALYAVPVVIWFRNRYWYFPLFIPVLWVPFVVITGFIFPRLPEGAMGGGMLLLFIHILNLGAVALGVALGMTVNAIMAAWRKLNREIKAQ